MHVQWWHESVHVYTLSNETKLKALYLELRQACTSYLQVCKACFESTHACTCTHIPHQAFTVTYTRVPGADVRASLPLLAARRTVHRSVRAQRRVGHFLCTPVVVLRWH